MASKNTSNQLLSQFKSTFLPILLQKSQYIVLT